MTASATLHPALKANVLITSGPDGIHVGAGSRGFLLKGSVAAPLIERLLSAIDGRSSLAQISSQLPAPAGTLFEQIVAKLQQQQLLTTGSAVDLERWSPYVETAAFFRELTAAWPSSMEVLVTRPVCVFAPSPLAVKLCAMLMAKGFGRIVCNQPTPQDLTRISSAADRERERGADTIVEFVDLHEFCGRLSDPAIAICMSQDRLPWPSELQAATASLDERLISLRLNGGVGIAGPRVGDALDKVDALAELCEMQGLPVPAATATICAALAVHQALMTSVPAPESLSWAPSEFRIVRPDGTISAHDVDVAISTGRPITTASQPPAEPGPAGEVVSPAWFDQSQGAFRWADEDLPPFPLALRTIAVETPCINERVVAWGENPFDAEWRAFALALGLLRSAAFAEGDTAGCPVYGLTEADAIEAAKAQSSLEDGALDQRQFVAVDLASIEERTFGMLARLARLYTGEHPDIQAWSESGCHVAVAVTGNSSAVGIGASLSAAAIQALGDALAALQGGKAMTRQHLSPYSLVVSNLKAATVPAARPPGGEKRWTFERVDTPAMSFWLGYIGRTRP